MEHVTRPVPGFPNIRIHLVEASRPWQWLAAGWRDFDRARPVSAFFGIVFSVLGFIIVGVAAPRPYLVTAAISGFFLLAPFLALGLYQISRRLEQHERPTLGDAVRSWRENVESIGLFAAFLAFAFVFWERLSAILFALFYGRDVPTMEAFSGWLFLIGDRFSFLLAYVALGAVVAAVVFAMSVISVPMMLDRRVDVVTAVVTSVRVVLANPRAMLLWAGMIAALSLAGVVLLLLGLIVTMPLLGHATWHAYRDLVQMD